MVNHLYYVTAVIMFLNMIFALGKMVSSCSLNNKNLCTRYEVSIRRVWFLSILLLEWEGKYCGLKRSV